MRRRDVLRGVGALGAGLVVGAGRAHAHEGESATGTVGGTTDDGYEPLGVVGVPGAMEAVVDNRTVYVATGDGYATVDVSDPTDPRVRARRVDLRAEETDGPLVNVQDLAVEGDTLVVAGPAHPRRNALAGLVVVDVSDPATPRERGFFTTDYPIHNCDIADGRAYLTANDGDRNALVVVDVERTPPNAVGSWSLLDVDDGWTDVAANRRTLHDVTVHDGVAVCAHWDAGTWLVDVSDPTDVTVVGRVGAPAPSDLSSSGPAPAVTPPGNHHYATLDETGTLLAVGAETFGVGVDDDSDGETDRVVGGPSGVDLWDVSTPTAPEKLSTIPPPQSDDATSGGTWTTAHNLDVADGTLYTSWYQGGVKRHDVSELTDPEETSWWFAPAETSFWTAQSVTTGVDGFFVATSRGVGDVPGRLYTFPDRPGELVDSSDGSVRPARPPAPPERQTADTSDDSTVSTPGVGVASATSALGLVAWWLWRRRLHKP